jgi:peptidoglycan/xylan/chitin deacetylase (PgdA/CDA1 family)
MVEADWEIASHGYRWIDYQYLSAEAVEREHIQTAIEMQTRVAVEPLSAFIKAASAPTPGLVVEEGGFLYDADSYADDLPYWVHDYGQPPPGHPLHVGHQRYAFRYLPRL